MNGVRFSLLTVGVCCYLQVYHNHVRPHLGLDEKTPGKAAGIRIKGSSKWKNAYSSGDQGPSLCVVPLMRGVARCGMTGRTRIMHKLPANQNTDK